MTFAEFSHSLTVPLSYLFLSRLDPDRLHNLWNKWNRRLWICHVAFHICDRVHNSHSVDHLAKSGIAAVKGGGIAVHDKELR